MGEKTKNSKFCNFFKDLTILRIGVFALLVTNGYFLFKIYNQGSQIGSLNKTIENLSALNNSDLKSDAQAIFQSSFKDDLVLNSFSNSITIIIAFFTTLIAIAAFYSFNKIDEDAKKTKKTVISLRNHIELELKAQNNLAQKERTHLEEKIHSIVSEKIKNMDQKLSSSFYEIYKLSYNTFIKTEYPVEHIENCIITLCGTINYGIEYNKAFILNNDDNNLCLEFYESIARNLAIKSTKFIIEVLPNLKSQPISNQIYNNLIDSYNDSFELKNFELTSNLEQIIKVLAAHILAMESKNKSNK